MSTAYHPLATEEWINKVTDKAVGNIGGKLECYTMPSFGKAPALQDAALDIVQDNHFLERTARGFIVEFLRQARDKTPDLNDKERWGWHAREMEKESRPGVFHATATMKWLLDRGLDKDPAFKILGAIIHQTTETFKAEYALIDPSYSKKSSVPLRFADRIAENALAACNVTAIPSK